MKRISLLIIILFCTHTLFSQVKTEPLNKVLQSISKSLNELETKTDLPAPAEVNVVLKTEVTKETNAGIKILFFKLGRKWKREQTNEVSYNFNITPKENFDKGKIEEELTKAMLYAIEEAMTIENDELVLSDFTVQISFVLERTNEVGGEYEIIALPITPNLGRSWKKKAVHTIKITFEK